MNKVVIVLFIITIKKHRKVGLWNVAKIMSVRSGRVTARAVSIATLTVKPGFYTTTNERSERKIWNGHSYNRFDSQIFFLLFMFCQILILSFSLFLSYVVIRGFFLSFFFILAHIILQHCIDVNDVSYNF
jgi:hypothetical protein